MKKEIKKLFNIAQKAKNDYMLNNISFEKAVELITPYKVIFDIEQKRIAKKYNKKEQPLNIRSFLR